MPTPDAPTPQAAPGPGANAPVRDQHGTPLPDSDNPTQLSPEQVDTALAALPGWERSGTTIRRQISVPADSRDGLEEGVRNVMADPSRVGFDSDDDGLAILLGQGPGGLRPADLEAAARIDGVLSGSGTDRGRN